MLKNIWYCIKKTSEWYFALLVLYIILTLVNATIPILSAFLPKLVIEKLTLGSDIKGLIGTIMVFMGSIAVLTGVSKFLTKYLYFEKFSINVHYLKLVANKGLTTDYINQENGIFRKLQEESFLCCNGHSPLTQVYDVLQSLGTSVLGIAVFSAVLYTKLKCAYPQLQNLPADEITRACCLMFIREHNKPPCHRLSAANKIVLL